MHHLPWLWPDNRLLPAGLGTWVAEAWPYGFRLIEKQGRVVAIELVDPEAAPASMPDRFRRLR